MRLTTFGRAHARTLPCSLRSPVLVLAGVALALSACHSKHTGGGANRLAPPSVLFGEPIGKAPFAVVPVAGASQVEWADLDGDGRRDLITLAGGGLRVFRADPRGALVEQAGALATAEALAGFALGDVDGDRRLDVVAGVASSGRIRLMLADGNGSFQHSDTRVPVSASTAPVVLALADLDGDDKLDILAGRSGAAAELYLNDGQGSFLDVSGQRLPRAVLRAGSLAIGDVDGDGDRDVVLGGGPLQSAQLWRNDGRGLFADVTSTSLPADAGLAQVELREMDGDGDLDLVLGSGQRTSGLVSFNLLYRNDGRGVFSRVPSSFGLPVMAVGDVDRDGDADLVGVDTNSVLRLLRNGGAGNLGDEGHVPLPDLLPTVIRLVDVDGDGAADLTAATADAVRVFLSNGRGRFRLPDAGPSLPWPPSAEATRTVVAVDLDRDGDMDLVFGGDADLVFGGDAVHVFLNDGAARFTDATATLLPAGLTGRVLAADLDGDGAVDLIAGAVMLRNDGRGRFAVVRTLPVVPEAVGVAGDMNGDGAVDLVFAQQGLGSLVLLLNDGRGAFRDASAQVPPTERASEALLFDADADGDLDLFLQNSWAGDHAHRLFHNDGTGTFADRSDRMPGDVAPAFAASAGDIDGDGRNDLVLAQDLSATRTGVRGLVQVLFDRGDRGYAPPIHLNADLGRGVSRVASAVAVTDIDGDGRADLVVATQNVLQRGDAFPADCGELLVARNTGTGSLGPFAIVTAFGSIGAGNGAAMALLLADLDEDGDRDLVSAHRLTLEGNPRSCRNGMLLNLTRHLVAPAPPFMGNSYQLRVFAQPGILAADAMALPFLSVRRLRVPTSLGVLQLDPSLMVTMPWVVIPRASGAAVTMFDVPRDTALQGGTMFVQALIATADGLGRLTNFVADVVP